jgi:hypothetical protein
MDLRAGPPTQGPASGGEREGPQFERCVSSYVPSPIPRWTGRLHMAVASPAVIAFANSFMARHPQDHARWFSRGSCNEADTGSLVLRPARLLALTNKVHLLSSFRRAGHPDPTSTITTRANSLFPRPDFHRRDTPPYGLRKETRKAGRKNGALVVHFTINAGVRVYAPAGL